MNSAELNDFAQGYARAWCRQDPHSVAAFFAVDGSLTVNDGDPANGREAFADVAQGFMTAFSDMIVTADRVTPGSGGTEFHWTLTGTNDGPGGTGKRVRISGYEIWQIGTNGLIADSSGHFDAAEYARHIQHGVGG